MLPVISPFAVSLLQLTGKQSNVQSDLSSPNPTNSNSIFPVNYLISAYPTRLKTPQDETGAGSALMSVSQKSARQAHSTEEMDG